MLVSYHNIFYHICSTENCLIDELSLTVIPVALVGYELIDSQRGAPQDIRQIFLTLFCEKKPDGQCTDDF